MAEPKWAQGMARHEIIARVDNIEAEIAGEGRLALDARGDSILAPQTGDSLWVPRHVYEDECKRNQNLKEDLDAARAAYELVHKAVMGEDSRPGGAAALAMMVKLLHRKNEELEKERRDHWAWEVEDLSDLEKNADDEYPMPDDSMASEEFRLHRGLQREAYVDGRKHEHSRHKSSEGVLKGLLSDLITHHMDGKPGVPVAALEAVGAERISISQEKPAFPANDPAKDEPE